MGGMKRRWVVTLAGAAAVFAFGLVSRSNAESVSGSGAGQTVPLLRVGIAGTDITNLDQARASTAQLVTGLALEQLMQIGPDGKLKPWLAEKVTKQGQRVYVYHLRKGVRFWNGNELTAADVAHSLNYNRDPKALTAYAFASVKSITALDRYRVAFTLKRPDVSFEWVPAQYPTAIFEKKFSDEHKGTMGRPGVLTMGTGPWRIASFNPTRGAELVANDRYWGGKPQIRQISIKFFANETNMALAFRAGEIDVVGGLGVAGGQAFAAASRAKLLTAPSCRQGFFSMNTKVAPWNDIHVRRAVAYAVNRTDLIKANGGYAGPNYTFVPRIQLSSIGTKPQVNRLLKSLPQYPFSVAKAKQEMAQSKYPNGFTATLPTFEFGSQVNASQAFADQLKAIGIDLDVEVQPYNAWIAAITGPPEKRPLSLFTSGCNSLDPNFYMDSYVLGGFNVANYAPARVVDLVRAGISTSNPTERLEVYRKLLTTLGRDMPYLPLWTVTDATALSSKFTWPRFRGAFHNRVWALEIKPK